jgi:hypothetical protein
MQSVLDVTLVMTLKAIAKLPAGFPKVLATSSE